MKKFALAVVLPIILLLTLQGCAELDEMFASSNANPVDEVEKAKYESFPFEQMAPNAPPPPRYETKGYPPGPNADEYVWRKGHWVYLDGNGFSWVGGYWLRKPAFSADWKQDMWLQRTYGWTYVPGHWQ